MTHGKAPCLLYHGKKTGSLLWSRPACLRGLQIWVRECMSWNPRIWTPKQPSTSTDRQQRGWGWGNGSAKMLTHTDRCPRASLVFQHEACQLTLFLSFEIWPFPQSVYFEQTLAYSSNLRVWRFSKILPDRGKPLLLRLPEAVGCEVLSALIVQWVRMLSSCRTVVSWLPTAQRLSKERVLFSASNQMLNTHEGTGQWKLIQSIKTNTHTHGCVNEPTDQGWRHRSLDDEILLPYLSGSLV